jgi:uncharacterized membrane protein YhhN
VLAFAAVTAVAVAVLLAAEARGWPRVAGLAKGVASSAFVAAAITGHAAATPYGRALLVALALSWLGDLLLLSHEEGPFRAGLGAVLAAHLAFGTAFLLLGLEPATAALALLPLAAFARLVTSWLMPHVEDGMRVPVLAYMVALTAMVALAAGAAAATGEWLIAGAAAAFLLSDISVARDRFVAPSIWNLAWGLPLYYAAQLAFASTAGLEVASAR